MFNVIESSVKRGSIFILFFKSDGEHFKSVFVYMERKGVAFMRKIDICFVFIWSTVIFSFPFFFFTTCFIYLIYKMPC